VTDGACTVGAASSALRMPAASFPHSHSSLTQLDVVQSPSHPSFLLDYAILTPPHFLLQACLVCQGCQPSAKQQQQQPEGSC
jgi:hypothetical protein